MRDQEYEWMYKLEESHWWFAGMRRITDAVIGSELGPSDLAILDAGCGTGINVQHFAARDSHRVFGIDVSPLAMERTRRRGLTAVSQASVTRLPFREETFDAVFSLDVIYQFNRNVADHAISEMHRVLRPSGVLFIRVPALDWMRSSHDDDVGGICRYTRGKLVQTLEEAGFEVLFASYANRFLFPLALASRFLKRFGIATGSDVRPLPNGFGWLSPLFRSVLSLEGRWFRLRRSLPIGLSVICSARRSR